MCGIVAALSKGAEFDSKAIAEKMLLAITHRGPDERGYLSFQVILIYDRCKPTQHNWERQS